MLGLEGKPLFGVRSRLTVVSNLGVTAISTASDLPEQNLLRTQQTRVRGQFQSHCALAISFARLGRTWSVALAVNSSSRRPERKFMSGTIAPFTSIIFSQTRGQAKMSSLIHLTRRNKILQRTVADWLKVCLLPPLIQKDESVPETHTTRHGFVNHFCLRRQLFDFGFCAPPTAST